MTGIYKISKQVCYLELSQYEITVDNVQEILKTVGDKIWSQFPKASRTEKSIIYQITLRLGNYLHETWDKEKKEGKKRTPEASLEYVNKFMEKNKPDTLS